MEVECGRARRLLWPDGGAVAATPAVIAAREHVSRCTACTAFFAEMRVLSTQVRSAVGVTAPLDTRDRAFAAVAAARAKGGRRRRLRLWIMAGMAAAALIFANPLARWRGRMDSSNALLGELAAEHGRTVAGERFRGSDETALMRWFESRVPFAVHVPRLDRARLTGGRVAHADDLSFAVIEYEVDGRAVSYFVVPSRNATHGEAPQLAHLSARGFNVVSWRSDGELEAMVGSLPRVQIEQLARQCIAQARAMS
jgi:anti-sigma factor RsiW